MLPRSASLACGDTMVRKSTAVGLGLIITMLAGGALADDVSPRPGQLLTRPDWKRRPRPEDFKRVYPPRAKAERVSGRVLLTCEVTLEGLLAHCQTSQESPEGYGFGEAAIELATVIRMTPMKLDGKPSEGGTVTLPIVFSPDR